MLLQLYDPRLEIAGMNFYVFSELLQLQFQAQVELETTSDVKKHAPNSNLINRSYITKLLLNGSRLH